MESASLGHLSFSYLKILRGEANLLQDKVHRRSTIFRVFLLDGSDPDIHGRFAIERKVNSADLSQERITLDTIRKRRRAGEGAHQECLVVCEHHPQFDGETVPAVPPPQGAMGSLLESEGAEQSEDASFASVTAAKMRVAPRHANRLIDSSTRVRAMPRRRKFESTAMKYT